MIIKIFQFASIFITLLLITACSGGDHGSAVNSSSTPESGFGLDKRPSNVSCLAPSPPAQSGIKLERAYPNLSFANPVHMIQEPANSDRWYIVQKGGQIKWFDATDENTTQQKEYLNISASIDRRFEGGLLSLAFHPDFANNKEAFLSYTVEATDDPDNEMISRITRMQENLSGDKLDTLSEEIILSQEQFDTHHNNGLIAFGPDNFLYIGLGDGGGGSDPRENSQDTTTLLGSLLRIDVDGGVPYTVPADNPFVGGGGREEIFAYGFRNPWRWSFDSLTGDLWLGDVGQNEFEEVNLVVNGANYGWDCYEASSSFESAGCPPDNQLTFPVAEYSHAEGAAVTGGFVYRGSNIPSLQGIYLMGDFGSGSIWGLYPQTGNTYERRLLVTSSLKIVSFAQANDGELYVVDFRGELYRLIEEVVVDPNTGPADKLSATGCVDASNPMLPASGLIPYTVNDRFWSDGAEKTRYMAIPDSATVTELPNTDFLFPRNSVLIKNFFLGGQIFETRLLTLDVDGDWAGYTYEWNDSLTDATLVDAGGKDKMINGQLWHYPGRTECMLCHTDAAGFSLGPESVQLNGEYTYAETGRTANQLETLEHIGIFSTPLSDAAMSTALSDSQSLDADLNLRARSYLHSNCSNCHQPGGTTQSTLDLRFNIPFNMMNLCNADPQQGDLGITQAKLLAPGEPGRSILLYRISNNDQYRMPPIGSNLLDTTAITLMTNWINSISNCNQG